MARIDSGNLLRITALTFFCAALAVPAALCSKKPSKAVTTDDRPIRKVYIRSGSADLATAAAVRLQQDTCITTVSSPTQADAVLDLGIALPNPGAAGAPAPDTFDQTPHAQTMGGSNTQQHRSYSASCSDSNWKSGCAGSYNEASVNQPAAGWPRNAGGNLDVSLASPGTASQELWAPENHSRKSWSEQLRIAAGCPVCPSGHFDRHKYGTYRNWIQTECPAMLTAQTAQ